MTADDIKKMKVGDVLWDQKAPGLHVIAFPKRSVYYFKYRTRWGQQRRRRLGDVSPALTLFTAREMVLKKRAAMANGEDPDAPLEKKTVRDVYLLWQKHRKGDLAKRTQVDYEYCWQKKILPALGKKLITDITRADCMKLHASMSDSPCLANRTLATLRAGFGLAEKWMWIEVNPIKFHAFREEARERYPTPTEAKRLLKAMAEMQETDPVFVAYVWLLIYTGARPGELLTAKRTWVNEIGLCLPEAKRRRKGRVIILTPKAREIIENLPVVRGNPYLFPGYKDGAHLVGTRKLWVGLLEKAKISNLQLRDLRRYFASLVLSTGTTLDGVGQLLGHTQAQTTRRYAYLMQDAKTKSAQGAVDKIQEILSSDRTVH